MAKKTSGPSATSRQPILSSKARKHLAMQALRRHTTTWLTEQGWNVRIMGCPVLVPTGRMDTIQYKVELLFVGDLRT